MNPQKDKISLRQERRVLNKINRNAVPKLQQCFAMILLAFQGRADSERFVLIGVAVVLVFSDDLPHRRPCLNLRGGVDCSVTAAGRPAARLWYVSFASLRFSVPRHSQVRFPPTQGLQYNFFDGIWR